MVPGAGVEPDSSGSQIVSGEGQSPSLPGQTLSYPGHLQEVKETPHVDNGTEADATPSHPGRSKSTKLAQQEHNINTTLKPHDPRLAAVVMAWDDLPEEVRESIIAMVKAEGKKE